jgi:hypothetical protein
MQTMSCTTVRSVLTAACFLTFSAFVGCSHFVERRAIKAFTAAIEKQDFDRLLAVTSEDFEEKAMRSTDALDNLKIVRLPTGKSSVVRVEDVDETEKHVTVEVGKLQRKMLYKLEKDEKTGKWVVDDVFVRRKKDGVAVSKSVSDQMDLLLTVREFVSAWGTGNREEVLDITTPELREALEPLPAMQLSQLTKRVASTKSKRSSFKPEAQMDRDVAFVTLPRATGKLVLSFQLIDGEWKVGDAAVESKGDSNHIASVRKSALALGAAVAFLDAYSSKDHTGLRTNCTQKFYRGSLARADLSTLKLPGVDQASNIKIQGERADFIIPGEEEIVRISMIRQEDPDDATVTAKYLVEDVAIFELDGGQEKRLSAWFTAHAAMRIFAESLAKADLPMLKQSSSADLNGRVWNRLSKEEAATLIPLAEIDDASPKVIAAVFEGAITEITVEQGKRAMTYILEVRGGELKVDDVLVPVVGRPNSMKVVLETMLPIRQFVAGATRNELASLQRASSRDFNRLIWQQLRVVPYMDRDMINLLARAPASIEESADGDFIVRFGTNSDGAAVRLESAVGRLFVDDVVMLRGKEAAPDNGLKQRLKTDLANGMRRKGTVVPPSLPASRISQLPTRNLQSPASLLPPRAVEPTAANVPFGSTSASPRDLGDFVIP